MDISTASVLPQVTGVGEFDLFLLLAQLGLHPQTGVLITLAVAGYLLIVRRLDQALGPIRAAVIEIQTLLGTAGMRVQFLLTESRTSPVSPSPVGRRLLQESGLDRMIERKWEVLVRRLERKLRDGPATPYDVQQKALAVLRGETQRKSMDPVKTYAYREGIELDPLLRLGALLLRDRYLVEHPVG